MHGCDSIYVSSRKYTITCENFYDMISFRMIRLSWSKFETNPSLPYFHIAHYKVYDSDHVDDLISILSAWRVRSVANDVS